MLQNATVLQLQGASMQREQAMGWLQTMGWWWSGRRRSFNRFGVNLDTHISDTLDESVMVRFGRHANKTFWDPFARVPGIFACTGSGVCESARIISVSSRSYLGLISYDFLFANHSRRYHLGIISHRANVLGRHGRVERVHGAYSVGGIISHRANVFQRIRRQSRQYHLGIISHQR